ncbi:hypothetical protein DPMN_038799 [Dreissena polymorpha]|uniref:Ig-like domain-containing protein n=1 Tax=Dreissena polymorpha TaxID=45954 RepID=A0A9D4MHR5_DREPO|nr:hypothetical protein DPMN_038799 [Dreissena polymorpha]
MFKILLFYFFSGDNAQTLLSVKTGDPDYVIAHKNCALALNCSVLYNASFGYPRFTWLKNGAPVEDSRRVHVLENGTLFIRRVLHKLKKDVTDQGTYRCIVELSEVGKVIVRDVKVDIAGEKPWSETEFPAIIPQSLTSFIGVAMVELT